MEVKLGMFEVQVTLSVNKLGSLLRDGDNERPCFSDFVFKIRLIRLGFSFQKQKFLYLTLQSTDSQSGVLTITPKGQL